MQKFSNDTVRAGAAAGAFSYIFFVCIFVLMYKNNEFSRYHAKQALVLFTGLMLCWVLAVIMPFLSFLFYGLGTIIYLVCVVAGIFKSLMGKAVVFPVVTTIADKLVI
jgi:uncharacterized membrane protein